jgi:hypothetical protein
LLLTSLVHGSQNKSIRPSSYCSPCSSPVTYVFLLPCVQVACEGVALLRALAHDPACVRALGPAVPILLAVLEVHGADPSLAGAALACLASVAVASSTELVQQVAFAVPLVLAAIRVHQDRQDGAEEVRGPFDVWC